MVTVEPSGRAPGFVGIDLAWGDRARSGLAIVAADGRLVDSTSVVSDDEIDGWLVGTGRAPVVIAVDAPLIVTNDRGPRCCEKKVSRAFGRFGASCHTSNLSRRWFKPTRASVLAGRHGWGTDPEHMGTAGSPTVIEVYPHPAMVCLFRLPRIIPYKAKSGRTVEFRRNEFGRLIEHMEQDLPALALDAAPRWAQLKREAVGAGRQVDLNRAEDEIDAVLCAHLAWLWHTDRAAMHVFGDAAAGYIVTPLPPPT